MKRLQIISLVIILGQLAFAQKSNKEELIIAYLNADRMYDLIDNEGAYDNDYTAGGSKFWGEQRYNDKLDRIEELVLTINSKELPGILVISELENKEVLDDLLKRKTFRKSKYRAIFNSHPGGKSSALLYSAELAEEQSVNLDIGTLGPDQNASINYTKVTLADGNKYHLFINNWVDREGGMTNTEQARINCAVALRKEIDNILNFEREARIIVLGSFYDEPTSKSILTMLNASNKRKNIHYRDLYNPFYDIHNLGDEGTVELNGELQMYDFIIVSPQLLRENKGYYCGTEPGDVAGEKGTLPLETFRGDNYLGGAGGHLPVSITLSRPFEK